MGANTFYVISTGSSAQEAFYTAVERERSNFDDDYQGYSGTIAEKNSFVRIPLPENISPIEYSNKLIDTRDSRINDKWGPAGCFDLGNKTYVFFGWASS